MNNVLLAWSVLLLSSLVLRMGRVGVVPCNNGAGAGVTLEENDEGAFDKEVTGGGAVEDMEEVDMAVVCAGDSAVVWGIDSTFFRSSRISTTDILILWLLGV